MKEYERVSTTTKKEQKKQTMLQTINCILSMLKTGNCRDRPARGLFLFRKLVPDSEESMPGWSELKGSDPRDLSLSSLCQSDLNLGDESLSDVSLRARELIELGRP